MAIWAAARTVPHHLPVVVNHHDYYAAGIVFLALVTAGAAFLGVKRHWFWDVVAAATFLAALIVAFVGFVPSRWQDRTLLIFFAVVLLALVVAAVIAQVRRRRKEPVSPTPHQTTGSDLNADLEAIHEMNRRTLERFRSTLKSVADFARWDSAQRDGGPTAPPSGGSLPHGGSMEVITDPGGETKREVIEHRKAAAQTARAGAAAHDATISTSSERPATGFDAPSNLEKANRAAAREALERHNEAFSRASAPEPTLRDRLLELLSEGNGILARLPDPLLLNVSALSVFIPPSTETDVLAWEDKVTGALRDHPRKEARFIQDPTRSVFDAVSGFDNPLSMLIESALRTRMSRRMSALEDIIRELR